MQDTEVILEELVERTTGLQPGRRLFHAINGLLLAWIVGWSGWPITGVLALLGGVLATLTVVDAARLSVPRLNILFFRAFLPLASPREHEKVASSTWYVAGVLLTAALFPAPIAGPAVLVLALADPVASLIGRRWGRTRFGGGTLPGSASFFVVAALILSGFGPLPTALGCAAVVTFVEAFPWALDDNLTIPVAAAMTLSLLVHG